MDITISGQKLAQILDINERYLRELAKEGIIVREGTNKYNLEKSIQKYMSYRSTPQNNLEEGLSAIELGAVLGLSERSVRELAIKGIVTKLAKGSYDPLDSARKYIEHLKIKDDGAAKEELARKNKAQRELQELKLQEASGELHKAEDIAKYVGDMLIAFKTSMRAIPAHLANLVAEETDVNKIRGLLLQEIDKSLLRLSDYRPEEVENDTFED